MQDPKKQKFGKTVIFYLLYFKNVLNREEYQTQESFNKFFVEQINNLESYLRSELKKTRIQLDNERDNRSKLENSLKYLEEQVRSLFFQI